MTLKSFPAERSTFRDERTGARITKWTAHPAMHHHFYFTNPTLAHDGSAGFFVSYRSGYPNLYAMSFDGWEITQITDRVDINPFSPSPSRVDSAIYFSAGPAVWRVDPRTGESAQVAAFPGARLGNCSLNMAGTLLAIGARYADRCDLCIVDLVRGVSEVASSQKEVGHIQFSPRDDNLLIYSGPVDARIWLHRRARGTDELLYRQAPTEWIVHESWRFGEVDEVIFPHWPYRVCAMGSDGRNVRTIAQINAWHVASSPDGRMLVCDTVHPDRGLLLIDAETGTWRTLCHPEATCRGTQWPHDLPAKGAGIDVSIIRSDRPEEDPAPKPDDPASTYGPQWSHPHPSFSADGRQVIYTSDRGGYSHVYSVEVPA